MQYAVFLLVLVVLLPAEEVPPEIRSISDRLAQALTACERDFHLAQAKAIDTTIGELEKLLKAERKKKASPLADDLERRMATLRDQAATLRDEPLFKAKLLEEKLTKKTLTPEEWDAAPGDLFVVQGKVARTPTKIRIDPGELYFILPHPTDTWQAAPDREKQTFRGAANGNMALISRSGEKQNDGFFVNEPGQLTLGPQDGMLADNNGSIRVKIIRVR